MGLFGRNKLPDDAVETEAKVLVAGPTEKGARQTGKRNIEHLIVLELGGREVEHKCVVPYDRQPLLGDMVPVTWSPSEPDRLEIHFDRMPVFSERMRASADAARKGDHAGAAEALGFTLRDPPSE